MRAFIQSHKALTISLAVVLVAIAAFLAFTVFGVHTLFYDDTVSEAAPSFDADADAQASASPTPTVGTQPDSSPTPSAPATSAPEIVTVASGDFVPRSHPTSGLAVVITDGGPQRFLSFQEFATDNGPDLNVYLVPVGADSEEQLFDDEFVDLGDLKGNVGDQNYEIPEGVDVAKYSTVVIWCVRFGVAFGAADLA